MTRSTPRASSAWTFSTKASRTRGWVMALSAARSASFPNTRAPSLARSNLPSAPTTPGKRSAMAARPGVPGSTTSRASTSASSTSAPNSRSIRVTVLLPEEMPPVSPKTCTVGALLRGLLRGEGERLHRLAVLVEEDGQPQLRVEEVGAEVVRQLALVARRRGHGAGGAGGAVARLDGLLVDDGPGEHVDALDEPARVHLELRLAGALDGLLAEVGDGLLSILGHGARGLAELLDDLVLLGDAGLHALPRLGDGGEGDGNHGERKQGPHHDFLPNGKGGRGSSAALSFQRMIPTGIQPRDALPRPGGSATSRAMRAPGSRILPVLLLALCGVAGAADFVGADSCKGCHPEAYEAWM